KRPTDHQRDARGTTSQVPTTCGIRGVKSSRDAQKKTLSSTDDPARPLAGTKKREILTADTRGCARSPDPYLSAAIRDMRGSPSYFPRLTICAARNEIDR